MSKRPRIKQADGSLLDLPLDAETLQGKGLDDLALKYDVTDAIDNFKADEFEPAINNLRDDIPTKTSQLENDSEYTTQADLNNVIEIAEGKTKTYVLSSATNTTFNSNEDMVAFAWGGTLTTITGESVDTTTLAIGDIILITELDVPDRYVASIESTTINFYKMETSKVDLTNYVTKDGYSMRASSTALKFYYNTGNGEKAIQLKSPTIPTKTSQLTNDSSFVTSNDLDSYLPKTSSSEAIINANSNVFRFGGSAGNGTLAVLANTGTSNYLRPGVTGTMDLGTNDEKWKDIYMTGKLTDGSPAAIKPSDSNEINFGSNANYIYFGYDNRVGSAGAVNTYNFGTHSGAAGAYSGRINCGDVYVDGGINQVARKSDIPSIGRLHIYDDGNTYSLDVSSFSYVEVSMMYNDSPGKTLAFMNTHQQLWEDDIIDFRIDVIENTCLYVMNGTDFGKCSLSSNKLTLQLQGNNDSSHIAFIYRGYK